MLKLLYMCFFFPFPENILRIQCTWISEYLHINIWLPICSLISVIFIPLVHKYLPWSLNQMSSLRRIKAKQWANCSVSFANDPSLYSELQKSLRPERLRGTSPDCDLSPESSALASWRVVRVLWKHPISSAPSSLTFLAGTGIIFLGLWYLPSTAGLGRGHSSWMWWESSHLPASSALSQHHHLTCLQYQQSFLCLPKFPALAAEQKWDILAPLDPSYPPISWSSYASSPCHTWCDSAPLPHIHLSDACPLLTADASCEKHGPDGFNHHLSAEQDKFQLHRPGQEGWKELLLWCSAMDKHVGRTVFWISSFSQGWVKGLIWGKHNFSAFNGAGFVGEQRLWISRLSLSMQTNMSFNKEFSHLRACAEVKGCHIFCTVMVFTSAH